ncbi:glycoside hydrolase family 6 protein, partial [Piromyces sp. E2]
DASSAAAPEVIPSPQVIETTPQVTETPVVPTVVDEPINSNTQSYTPISASTQNFFLKGEIYRNPRFVEEVESSIPSLTPELQAKAEKVKDVPTAVWLAWDGAPAEVEGHLVAAGSSQTVVFLLYMIPTRDCNSLASAGGASDLNKYIGYVDNISNTIRSHPETNVVMVVEPDTLGNLVTGTSEACKNVHTLHKNALSYAINVFGAMDNVSVYLDAAHGMWLSEYADETAAVIREILDNAPNGKIRGFSTNVSNFQPIYTEYEYYLKLTASLEALGITGMHFILDTGRNGADVYESFGKTKTWCNFIGTGLGERPKANPDASMPLIDAYMWLKTPGEADGSAVGDRADPVCAREDSLQLAPDAGSWFHDYFVQLLENANPTF